MMEVKIRFFLSPPMLLALVISLVAILTSATTEA